MQYNEFRMLGDTQVTQCIRFFAKDRLRKRLKIERVVLEAIVDCTRN